MVSGFFGRAIKGAAGGAVAGGIMGGGDFGNIAGGAIGGALGYGIGGRYTGQMGKLASNVGGMAYRGGLGMSSRIGRYGVSLAANGSPMMGGALAKGGVAMGRGLMGAKGLIGNNRALINKWGGPAAATAGIASAGYIGSSMVNANRGY